ncbi:MAG: ParB/RepB/Spo0J family partition protein [Planctomycetota bacterium]|jgi:ParB/RepB/Spo0J family partition protein
MVNSIKSIALDKLIPHPGNPNLQSKDTFSKLLHNIERTGRYEPLVVRPCPAKAGFYQIINGHHRHNALAKLGCKTADCIVWDINDEQTDILLATLNRLGGSDVLAKKLKLLERLNKKMGSTKLAKLVPQTRKQIERLTNLKLPSAPARINAQSLANPLVFFLTDEQQRVVEKALLLAEQSQQERTKAAKRAAALSRVARHFLNKSMTNSRSPE